MIDRDTALITVGQTAANHLRELLAESISDVIRSLGPNLFYDLCLN